ncbi:MAG: RNA polymerase sigma factor [Deltaproteobacteria bacterium]|nr:RNA polymerase sigma factor [Deltaproteobacteria bacterium]MBN2673937.1 RNA polymerase sigma factor [Deltaproteobacteria bacterium]
MKQNNSDTGETPDFHSLFEVHGERVYRWVLFLGVDEGSAEEITQEVFITAMKKQQMPEDEKAQAAWLFQTVRRHVANFRRSAWVRRVFRSDEIAMREASVSMDEQAETSLVMRQVLSRLPQKWIEVLIMHDLDGYTRDEISTILSIAEGTVASRLRCARAAFIEKWVEVNDA